MGSAHKTDYISLMHLFCLAAGEEEPVDDDIVFDQKSIDQATVEIGDLLFTHMGFPKPYRCSLECSECEIYQFALWLQHRKEGNK